MILTAVISKDELVRLIANLTPLRITLDHERGRTLTIGRPDRVELVPGKGLRLGGEARITWDALGMSIPVTVRAWQALLVPRIAVKGTRRVLLLDPIIEELDLKNVPAFVDEKIASAAKDGIERAHERLAWDFSRALGKRIPLSPARVSPKKAFDLFVADARVAVGENDLTLSMRFEARVLTAVPKEATAPVSFREPAVASAR